MVARTEWEGRPERWGEKLGQDSKGRKAEERERTGWPEHYSMDRTAIQDYHERATGAR
jgi:hypothetical protein